MPDAAAIRPGVVQGAYPERPDETLSWLDSQGEAVRAALERLARMRRSRWRAIPGLVEAHADDAARLDDDSLRQRAVEVGLELRKQGFDDAVVARAFALVREAAQRRLGQRPYDVQLIGGWVLLQGAVAEMETGEGKTLTATLPACTAALAGVPVHVITVNDYLARRDAEALRPLYESLGLSVGLVVSGMDPESRRRAYACDVAYCTGKEVAFDYLKDRIALRGHDRRLHRALDALRGEGDPAGALVHRGLHFAIVDEADSVLIDEARTPLIIADRRREELEEETYGVALELAEEFQRGRDFELDERERRVALTDEGCERLADLAEPRGGIWSGPRRREEFVRMALQALHLFHRDQHYLVADDKVQIIDENTGRVMPDRSWEQGLHQLMEIKEGVTLTGRQETRARISFQRFFRRYLHLAGMTGTARAASRELGSVYGLGVVRVPTNRPLLRRFEGERVFARGDEKWRAVVERVAELQGASRPVLVGTRSVATSEELAARLREAGIEHQVLNARQDEEEATVVERAGEPGRVTVATNMAGRGTDIRLAPGLETLGGLHVIATERHESARIDRQLYGRCGRQGDPGSCEAFLSLEDELIEVHAPAALRAVARRALVGPVALRRLVLHASFSWAQRAAGRLHARVRRDLLRHDARLDALLAFSGRPE
jgi:preprotein translocase subunit SecA